MMNEALIIANLTSPAVLAFLLGAFAAVIRSDLRVPQQVHEALSMYLLFAIGLKGGIAIRDASFAALLQPMAAVMALGLITPLIGYAAARTIGRQSIVDSAAMAAHYGSVSAVTFMAALAFAEHSHISVEPYLPALLVVLEIPGIVVALTLARLYTSEGGGSLRKALGEVISGKSVILLGGGVFIGLFAEHNGIVTLKQVFIAPFMGVLTFFLLEMGVVAASRLRDSSGSVVRFLLGYGIGMPPVLALLGGIAGHFAGLSAGGSAVLATMAASASYIAAPAAVKIALPRANPALYLTSAISITLPFNIAIGIPLYFSVILRLFHAG